MTNPEAPPSKGPVAGKYELIRMIGRGGMGSVWEARHVSLGTPSAIKFIEAEYADSQEARSRFDKEAKAAATIQSKHAIQIYDHGVTDDGKPYIVMELLQGEPLDKRIERFGRMSLQDTARILQQVSRALARAHERGIIHRDLKPENIFIVRNPDDDDEVAKVLDFGIAKMQGTGNAGMTSSTKTGAVLGTPFYMSPEQARGLRNVDHRTDVWSLGVIAFKCVTGKLPFDGESVGDLLVKICTAPLPVPSHVGAGLPPNFDAWFMRALERDPERRFGSVSELSDALCFAAGIATRGGPMSAVGSFPNPASGQAGAAATPQRGSAPYYSGPQQPNTYGSGPQAPTGSGNHAPTPMPGGAMTNAPFTSEPIPGVSSTKSKLVAGGIIAGVLVLGAAVVGGVMLRRTATIQTGTVSAVSAPLPTSSVVAVDPPPAPPVPAPEKSAEAASLLPGAANDSKAGAATTATAKAPPPPAPVPKAASAVKPPSVPPLPPASTSPAPLPTPPTPQKKPSKLDPGY